MYETSFMRVTVLEAAYIYELISGWDVCDFCYLKTMKKLDPTEPHLKASDIAPELSREWKSMSKDKKENLTKDYMDELEEYRANKSMAVHNHTQLNFSSACVISGVTGLVSNYKESYLMLKKELTSLILDKLNQAVQVPVPKMFYNNFNTQITAKHGVIIDNWPLKNFMTCDEWKQWDNIRFQSALLQHDNVEGHDDPDVPHANTVPSFEELTDSASMAQVVSNASGSHSSTSYKQTHAPFEEFVNVVSGTSGIEVPVHKKHRKERSDKGKKRGPRHTALS
ncbi:hypothetical protein F4604DRAFT_1684651 [Suillus subluteus]|nr:hypothetical protein F4604DRAFT_1684651 [Suillus subluteus]